MQTCVISLLQTDGWTGANCAGDILTLPKRGQTPGRDVRFIKHLGSAYFTFGPLLQALRRTPPHLNDGGDADVFGRPLTTAVHPAHALVSGDPDTVTYSDAVANTWRVLYDCSPINLCAHPETHPAKMAGTKDHK